MKLTLGFSPCPNDTFIFDALVNGGIACGDLQFEPVLEDVQTLNEWAESGKLDITKLSFPALFRNSGEYRLLTTGAALGKGVGPLLIAKSLVDLPSVEHCRVAIPGEQTTANFLLHHAFPKVGERVPMLFSEIEDAVLSGRVDLGVIIHENRFTYQQRGLHKVADLGEVWELHNGAAIPLGCIAIRRSLGEEVAKQVEAAIRQSQIESFQHYPAISPYVRQHAQAMDESVMRQHIELYVNEFTMDLGEEGKKAIDTFARIYTENLGAPAPRLWE
ncbi:1,4-dihydroxy-6-naphthoate synthase [Flaviaesturariibacter amylovorans]|uniref:1,4-dihydroxy-6-naphtoate synthase n=1 Tax=Flaviaesturariibacter amylovorans TaxID=1084520 RepID=A0ABP8H3K1_9BACT